MRGRVYVHNKKMNALAKSLSEKVINVSLGFLLVASPVIGIILPKTVHAASAGDVVITEFMADPSVVSDTNGEWIEIQNTTGSSADITGWDIDTNTISGSVSIPANGRVVICKNASTAINDGVVCDATSGFSLTNTGDTINLRDETNTVINSVTYTDLDVDTGHSTNVNGGLSIENTYRYSVNNYGSPANNTPLDDFDPVVTPTQPSGPNYFNDNSSFKAIMTDEGLGNTGIATGTFRIWNGSGDTGLVNMGDGDGDDEFAGSTNTNLLPDGIYQIDFTATDNAGNSSTATVNNVVIDNTTPLADISSPLAGSTVSGAVAIHGSGSDANLRGYNLRIYQTGSINPAGLVKTFGHVTVFGGSFSGLLASWDSTTVPDGNYTIQLSVRDGPFNTGYDHVPVTVDNVPDPEPEDNTGSIQGRKFRDVNSNGVRDDEDKEVANRLNGWTINLYRLTGAGWYLWDSTVTGDHSDGQGVYRFNDLPWDTYYVCEVMQDSWLQTRPFDGMGSAILNNSPNSDIEGQYCLVATIEDGDTGPGTETDDEREREVNFGNIEEVIEVDEEEEEQEEEDIVPPTPSPDPDIDEEENTDSNTNNGGGGAGGGAPATTAFAGGGNGGGGEVLGTDTTTDGATEDETEEIPEETSSVTTDTGEVLAESDENSGSWLGDWWKWLLLLIPLMLLLFFILARRRKDEEETA